MSWACSAQQPKLLPKLPPQKQQQAVKREMHSRLDSIFSQYEKEEGLDG